jgi:hypothetical protein
MARASRERRTPRHLSTGTGFSRAGAGSVRRLAVVLASALVASVLVFAAGPASAVTRKALINADTVSGSPSQEEAIATAQGYAVTVVSDATWGTYTASDFGQYDLLIAGDPFCGSLPPGLVSSASVYGPVVLGLDGGRTLAGNRIVVGTDPVLHDGGDYTSPNARGTIIREGIAYAGAQPGTTGMYFDSTCAANYHSQSAETLAILTAMSAGAGAWTIDAIPPCGGNVSLIASNPSFADLTTASLQGWSCSVHESFPTFPSDWSALAVATDTPSTPTCGVDPGTGLNACGEAYILVAGSSIVVSSEVISVSPLDSTNPTGTSHTVTANVHVVGGTPPVVGQLVTFTVTGQNAGATGVCAPADCKSDVNGDVSFTYTDGAGAGDDTIKASFTDGAGSLQTATAQKHWASVTHHLTVSKAGTGTGTVTSAPAGITCGATCGADFGEGTSVVLTATPDAGSVFTGWSGDCTGTGPCMVTMDQDRAVTATFAVSGPPDPRVLKQDAVASLRALLPTGDPQADRKIKRAIKEIEDSLDPELWLDDSHLTDKGRRVFHEEGEAANKLTQIEDPPVEVASVLDALVAADQALARTAIDEAIAAGGDAQKLADADREMEKALEEIGKGRFGRAIKHYEHAWNKAQKAVK